MLLLPMWSKNSAESWEDLSQVFSTLGRNCFLGVQAADTQNYTVILVLCGISLGVNVYDMSFYIFMWKLDDSHAWSRMTQRNFWTTFLKTMVYTIYIFYCISRFLLWIYSKFCKQKMQKKKLTRQKYTVFYSDGLVIDKKILLFLAAVVFGI